MCRVMMRYPDLFVGLQHAPFLCLGYNYRVPPDYKQRLTHVPKFGNWSSDEDIPYTAVFDHARAEKGASGRIINPNDPEENPAAFAQIAQKNHHGVQQLLRKNSDPEDSGIAGRLTPSPRTSCDPELNAAHVTKLQFERHTSREDREFKRRSESPAGYQYAEASGQRAMAQLSGHQYPGRTTTPGGSLRLNIGDSQRHVSNASHANSVSEHSIGEHHYQSQDQSAVHPYYQRRHGSKPLASSPASHRKVSAEGGAMFAPATPGRSKLRGGTRADETSDRSAPLPKFGAWNENDPASAEGFTFIFNKAREEKQTGGVAKIITMPPEMSSHNSSLKQTNGSPYKLSVWCCCGTQTVD